MPITSNRVAVYGSRQPAYVDFMDITDNKELGKSDIIRLLTEQNIVVPDYIKELYQFILDLIALLDKDIIDALRDIDKNIIDRIKDRLLNLLRNGLDIIGETIGVKSLITPVIRTLYDTQGVTYLSSNNAVKSALERFIIASAIVELISRGEERAYTVLVEANERGVIDNRSIALAMSDVLKDKDTNVDNLSVVMDMLNNETTQSAIPYIPDIREQVTNYISNNNIKTGVTTSLIAVLNSVTDQDSYLDYISNPNIVSGIRADLQNSVPVVDYEARGTELSTNQLIAVLGSVDIDSISTNVNSETLGNIGYINTLLEMTVTDTIRDNINSNYLDPDTLCPIKRITRDS